MTVLSQNTPKDAIKGFSQRGRYSYLQLLLQFAGDWKVDLPWVRARITALTTSVDFAWLFRDIITADHRCTQWAAHPQARPILWDILQTMRAAWDSVLAHGPHRDQLVLEYLADALTHLRKTTCRT